MRAKNRGAGLDSFVSIQRKLGQGGISSRPAIAACPIQIDDVRLPLGHRA